MKTETIQQRGEGLVDVTVESNTSMIKELLASVQKQMHLKYVLPVHKAIEESRNFEKVHNNRSADLGYSSSKFNT